jgi:hypothetical protein
LRGQVKKRERPRQLPNGDFLRLVPFSVGELDFQDKRSFFSVATG